MTHIQILGVCPDLVLLFSLSCVLVEGVDRGIWVGLAGGLVLDALSAAPFGFMTLALVVVSAIAGLGQLNVFRTAWYLPYVTVFLASLAYYAVFVFLLAMAGRGIPWWSTLWRVVLPATLVNVLFMVGVYPLTHWLFSLTHPKQVEWQ